MRWNKKQFLYVRCFDRSPKIIRGGTKNVPYDVHLCPIIVKWQRAPNAKTTLQIVDRHYEELKALSIRRQKTSEFSDFPVWSLFSVYFYAGCLEAEKKHTWVQYFQYFSSFLYFSHTHLFGALTYLIPTDVGLLRRKWHSFE